MLRLFSLFYILIFLEVCLASLTTHNDEDTNPNESDSNEMRTENLLITFSLPYDGILASEKVIVQMDKFKTCDPEECSYLCGTKNPNTTYCHTNNTKICMCSGENFQTSQLEGTVITVDSENLDHKNCSIACSKRNSHARVYTELDKSMHCICLTGQLTQTGVTLCDQFAVEDVCKTICQTDTAKCTFNGVCLCRRNWELIFNLTLPFLRKQVSEDNGECLNRCTSYHHDYRTRVFDIHMVEADYNPNATYKINQKFCTCGPWINMMQSNETTEMIEQGFQVCTGLKCKQRCGMDEAMCEVPHRRACLCNREGINIGKHLWSRLPSHEETKCYETCAVHGLDARVIEWNPLFIPSKDYFQPNYKRAHFQFLYDGKFCHCIQVQKDMHQYRPCTDELCKRVCNHHEAKCSEMTRRACMCNTHQLALGLGRKPDPGEVNCDIACRYGLFDALILDVKWEVPVDEWSVKIAKYCSCVRPVSPSGLSHCDNYDDQCPQYCNKKNAYCTRQKYCHCGVVDKILDNPLVRLGDGKEQDECGQMCRSWLWPLAEDLDNKPYIYDQRLERCNFTKTCPVIDTSPWKPDQPGALSVSIDALEQNSNAKNRRFCLCAKSRDLQQSPGTRILPVMEPRRIDPTLIPCVGNHTCEVVGKGLHVIE